MLSEAISSFPEYFKDENLIKCISFNFLRPKLQSRFQKFQSQMEWLKLRYVSSSALINCFLSSQLFQHNLHMDLPTLAEALSTLKRLFIAANFTLAMIIFVPFVSLIALDFIVYIWRLGAQFVTTHTTHLRTSKSRVGHQDWYTLTGYITLWLPNSLCKHFENYTKRMHV